MITKLLFLGPDAVKYIVNHAELSTVVCSAVAFPKLATCSPQCPSLKRIILMDAIPSNARSLLPSHIELYTMTELIERGSKTPRAPTPPSADDLFCVMYTSGTTGDPKVCCARWTLTKSDFTVFWNYDDKQVSGPLRSFMQMNHFIAFHLGGADPIIDLI